MRGRLLPVQVSERPRSSMPSFRPERRGLGDLRDHADDWLQAVRIRPGKRRCRIRDRYVGRASLPLEDKRSAVHLAEQHFVARWGKTPRLETT